MNLVGVRKSVVKIDKILWITSKVSMCLRKRERDRERARQRERVRERDREKECVCVYGGLNYQLRIKTLPFLLCCGTRHVNNIFLINY